MPDIFDNIAAKPPVAQGGDIFDQVAAAANPAPIPNKSFLLSPSERTGTHMVADPNDAGPDVRLGNAIPDAAMPALNWFQKNVNDRLNKVGAATVAAGHELGRDTLGEGADPNVRKKFGLDKSPTLDAALGVTGGVGSVVGGALDPRNLPFLLMGGGEVRPILQRLISGGFAAQMGKGAIDAAKNLSDNWDKLTPEQRWELGTQAGLSAVMTAAAGSHALTGEATPAVVNESEVSPKVPESVAPDAESGLTKGPLPSRFAPITTGGLRLRGTKTPAVSGDIFDIIAPTRIEPAPASDATTAQPVFQGAPTAGGSDAVTQLKDKLAELAASDSGSLDAGRVASALPNFFEQDVQPHVEAARKGLRETFNLVTGLIAPRQEEGGLMDSMTGQGVPEKALNSIMKMKGDRDQALAEADLRMADTRSMFDKMPEEDRLGFIDNMKSGSPQPTPELNDLADFYRSTDDANYRKVIEVQAADNPIWKELTPGQRNTFVDGVKAGAIDDSMPQLRELADSLLAYKENHFRVLWKTVPGQDADSFKGLGRAPLQGTKGFFKQSTLDSISEGIAAGGEPVTTNPQRLFELSQADTMKWITAQRMWQAMKNDGFAQYLRRGESMPEGSTQLHDNIARVMFPAKSGEGMIEPGQWVINSNAGRILNNYLSRDLIRETALGRGLMGWKNLSTAAELSFSPFHAVAMGLESVASEMGLGLTRGWNEGALRLDPAKMAEGVKDIALAPTAPVKLSRLGGSAIRLIKNPEDFLATTRGQDFIQRFPEAKRMVDDLFAAGGRIRMHEDYRLDTDKSFTEALHQNNPIGAALRAIPALAQQIQRPLFDSFIPRLKIGRFLRDYSQLLSDHAQELGDGKITRQRLAQQAWDRTENLFGEMNFDNLFWNRTVKTGLQAAFRSVTWQLGNVRSLTGAAVGELTAIKNFAKDVTGGKMPAGQKVPLPRLDPNAGWFIGMTITTAALGAVIQKTMTGTYPQDWKDYLFPKVGGMDKRGKPNRISLPTYFRTDYGLVTNPGQTARGALSSAFSRTSDVVTNKDWRGQQVYDPTASLANKVGTSAKYLLPKPFSVANYQRSKDATGSGVAGLRGAFGFNNAPYDLDTSPAERLARQIVTDKIGAMTRTPDQVASSEVRGRLTAEARNQDEAFRADLRNAIRGGTVSQRQGLQIAGNARQSYLSGLVTHLGVEDTLRIWDVASPNERTELKPLLLQKATGNSFDELSPSKQKIVAAQVRSAIAGTKSKLTLQGAK